ncbi:hypothetical protein BKA83DRAFT_4120725 [Pisolithus microcarpus]|nr:hypothetical protein BKA83DRAFT_4120725 [Pisolithus microcarpus]
MPEAHMLACVHGNTSLVTTAMYKDFGDPHCHPSCTTATALAQLTSIKCDVLDVDQYFAASHFPNGITKLKQVGGRAQRDIQQYIVIVIAGAADPDIIRASLQEFHNHKDAIIQNGHHCREKTKQVLRHWHILKLELMQSIAPSIKQVGSILQWSADTTEHAHIEVIKDPASTTNNHSYNTQICQSLDHSEKCQLFDTALALRGSTSEPTSMQQLGQETNNSDSESSERDKDRSVLDGDYLNCEGNITQNFHTFGSQRQSPPDVHLLFKELHVWYKVHLQQKAYHDPSDIASTLTVHAHPPDHLLKYGRYDAAIMNVDDQWQWPSSGLQGEAVVLTSSQTIS